MMVLAPETPVDYVSFVELRQPDDTPQARRIAEERFKDYAIVKHFKLYSLFAPFPLCTRAYVMNRVS